MMNMIADQRENLDNQQKATQTRQVRKESISQKIRAKFHRVTEEDSQNGIEPSQAPDFGKFDAPPEPTKKKRGRPAKRKEILAVKDVELIHQSLYGLFTAFTNIEIRVNPKAQELINIGWCRLAEEKQWNLEGVGAYGMLTIGYTALLTDNLINREKDEDEPKEKKEQNNHDTGQEG
jgi:hypothetical protein